MYYEVHVTVMVNPKTDADPKIEVERLKGWKHSNITDDIVLGKGQKHYATKHFKHDVPLEVVFADMNRTAYELTRFFKVVRKKVELVLFDSKSSGPKRRL